MITTIVFVDEAAFDLAEQLAPQRLRYKWLREGYDRYGNYVAIKVRHLLIVKRYRGDLGKIVFQMELKK